MTCQHCNSDMTNHTGPGFDYYTCPVCGWAMTDTAYLSDQIIVQRINGSSYIEIQDKLHTSSAKVTATLREAGIIAPLSPKSKKKKPMDEIKRITKEARKHDMSYGQWVAMRERG